MRAPTTAQATSETELVFDQEETNVGAQAEYELFRRLAVWGMWAARDITYPTQGLGEAGAAAASNQDRQEALEDRIALTEKRDRLIHLRCAEQPGHSFLELLALEAALFDLPELGLAERRHLLLILRLPILEIILINIGFTKKPADRRTPEALHHPTMLVLSRRILRTERSDLALQMVERIDFRRSGFRRRFRSGNSPNL